MNFGIIGCGLIGRKRASSITNRSGLKLVAAADLDLRRAEMLCVEFGGRATSNANEVIDSEAEVIIVSTTHDQLAPIALMALRAGKHVLLEKPGAKSAKELEPVATEAAKRGLIVKVGFNHRFHSAILQAKELVKQGAIDRLMFVRGRYGHGGRVGYEKEWRFRKEMSGGGELLDQGSHLIDLSRWFLGEFTTVYGILPRYYWPGEVEDNCFLTLQTDDGKIAQLHATWTEWKNTFCLEIYGQSGKLQIDGLGGSYGPEQLSFYKMLPQMGPPQTTIWQYPFPDASWDREMEELLCAISEKRSPLSDVNDAMENLRLVDKLYRQQEKVS
ncbi:MAG: Gfo/Idh/MocA family oxidoreductase [Holosporaceae bacterium]|jgi:predicted dehydrogenase|nr:Gfo/Idh/MocA family oxidoreductase [Holosporaceae bacterium]